MTCAHAPALHVPKCPSFVNSQGLGQPAPGQLCSSQDGRSTGDQQGAYCSNLRIEEIGGSFVMGFVEGSILNWDKEARIVT